MYQSLAISLTLGRRIECKQHQTHLAEGATQFLGYICRLIGWESSFPPANPSVNPPDWSKIKP